MLEGKKIILGISGSIAAYKAVFLLRLLKKAGAEVKVVITPSVKPFLGELSLSSLSGQTVFSEIWEENWSAHVELGTWADLMIVAPATANTLAKFAHGLCDNALTAVFLAARCPVMVAPAMDADMYIHPRTSANLKTLQEDGHIVLPTGTGFLASGLEGPGRLLEPEEIMEAVNAVFETKDLEGVNLLVTAGPTRESIDPVRFLSNHSSGKMGYAIAQTAQKLGANVHLIAGPTNLPTPTQLDFQRVQSASDMFEAVKKLSDQQDVIIMAAAVADYTPVVTANQKIKKKGDALTVELRKTQDILHYVGQHKREGQILVGFAMETEKEQENALKKLHKKNLDFIVLNSLREPGAGFAHDTNKITILDNKEQVEAFPLKSKVAVARDILRKVAGLLGK